MSPVNAIALRCFRCGAQTSFDPGAYTCTACEATGSNDPGVLDVIYDYTQARQKFVASKTTGVFRYQSLLPVAEREELLPAGGTALIAAPRLAKQFGLRALYLKDETRNPTRCLKDRATAVGVALALAQNRRTVYCASAGNAAISLAGFSAHAGLECHAFVPSQASTTRLGWLRRYGAHVHISSGNYDQAFDEAESAGRAHGWYSRNCALNPFLVEGKKTVSFEIAEQLGWHAPDIVVAPVGDGCTLGAIGKGFRELEIIGATGAVPYLAGVQSEAIHPLVDRFAGTSSQSTTTTTRAASIAVRRPRNALRLLAELRESSGTLVAVPDDEIAAAQKLLAEEAGVVAEFTSAATLAGLERVAQSRSLEGKVAVLVITGGRLDDDER